jgi:hypothetical protein
MASQNQNEINFLKSADPILPELDDIFGDCTEEPYSKADNDALNAKVDERVQQNLPPCLMNSGGKAVPPPASNPHRGDGRVWFQIVRRAGEAKKPLIFVTGDERTNWWRTARLGQNEKNVGPHFLLIHDIESASGKRFLMYTQEDFLANAPKYLQVPDQSEGIEDVKKLREATEEAKGAGTAVATVNPGTSKDNSPKRLGDTNEKDSSPVKTAEAASNELNESDSSEAKKVD